MTKRFKVMNNEEHRATMQRSLHSSVSKACLNSILLQEVAPGIRNSRQTPRVKRLWKGFWSSWQHMNSLQ